ncbi:nucleolin [Angomonas deanei]|uniref:Uncharacterized protein n=1 Tax=Angomonas deanei TaxID=59799 RepID=A0A7G2CSL4_9TRYP|nr:nucleolin [Angomonas deanei]CAD2222758.1 hypothetical protein, conserved [Angomonas deanei]|eukprot:EPY20817.1 nucleolin [Angomonas deanei]
MTKRRKKKTEKEADVEHYPTEDLTSRADNSEIPSEDAHRKRKKKKKSDAEETNNREEKNGAPAEKLEVENGRKEGEVVPSSDSKKKRSKPDEESHVERLDTGDKSPDPESQQDEQRRKKKRKKKTTNGDSINVSEYNDTDEEERLAIALHKQKLNDEATTATEASSKRNSQLLVSEKASPTETRRSSKVPESTYVSEAPPQRRPGTNTPLPIENSSGGEFTSREPNHSASPEKKSSDSPIQLVPEEPDQSIVVDMEGSGVAHSDTRRVLNKIRPREESVEMREFSPRDAEASHFVEDNHSVQVVPPNADISQIQQEADRYYGETLYASEEGVYTDSDSSSSSSSDRGPP